MSATNARSMWIAIAACVAVLGALFFLSRPELRTRVGAPIFRDTDDSADTQHEPKLDRGGVAVADRAPVVGSVWSTQVPDGGHWLEVVVYQSDDRRTPTVNVVVDAGATTNSLVAYPSGLTGSFLCGPFEPGSYHVRVTGALFKTHDESVQVATTEHVTRCEIVVEPWTTILVRMRTRDGQPLSRAAMSAKELDYSFAVRVIATPETPQNFADLPMKARMASPSNAPLEFPLGHYRGIGWDHSWVRTSDLGGRPDDAVGELMLSSLPAIVTVEHEGRLIATQVVTRTMSEVVFVLDVDDLMFSQVTMRMRILDALTSEPLVLARVQVADPQTKADPSDFDAALWSSWSRLARTDEAGRITVQVPESVDVVMRIAGPRGEEDDRVAWMRKLTMPKQGVLDLGDISLERAVRLSGRLLRPDGPARRQTLELLPYDAFEGGTNVTVGAGVSTETTAPTRRITDVWSESGEFSFTNLAKGRYLLRSSVPPTVFEERNRTFRPEGVGPTGPMKADDEWIPRPRIVDLRDGSITELDVPLEAAAKFRLGVVPPRVAGTHLEVSMDDGLSALEEARWSSERATYALVPGAYRFRWTLEGRTLEVRDVTLGAGEQVLDLP